MYLHSDGRETKLTGEKSQFEMISFLQTSGTLEVLCFGMRSNMAQQSNNDSDKNVN